MVWIDADGVNLYGDMIIPEGAKGIVLFAHGSGSSRLSPRNRLVASIIRDAGIGTLLFDLLTPGEAEADAATGELRFDIELLAERLLGATRWIGSQQETRNLAIGYFGASTGGGAALMAAAAMGRRIAAVVSRGGRPDLAGGALYDVLSPTLLIVGGLDSGIIRLNEIAMLKLHCGKEMALIPGATHLFEERGKLEEVARISARWFNRHMTGTNPGKEIA